MLTLEELKRRLAVIEEQIKIAQRERDRLRVARHRYKHSIRLMESYEKLEDFDESD